MTNQPGIYLFVFFDWPDPFVPEHSKKARRLHDVVQGKDWIKEAVAASGGVGGEHSSVWVFWLESYASLERLLRDPDDEMAAAYGEFFGSMRAVRDFLRQEVMFV